MNDAVSDPASAYLFYVSGISFFVLGVVAISLPTGRNRMAYTDHLWLLGIFGILYGITDFLEPQHQSTDAAWLHWLIALASGSAYVALLESGRRTLRSLSPGVTNSAVLYLPLLLLLSVMTMLSSSVPVGLANGTRLFLGIPSALIVGLAVVRTLRSVAGDADARRMKPWLIIGASAALLYSGLLLFSVHADPSLPTWLPDETEFARATGFPVQLPMALAALLAAIALIATTRISNLQHMHDLDRVLDIINGFVYRCRNEPGWSLLYIEGNVREVTGHSREEILSAENPGLAKFIHPADREDVWQQVRTAVVAREGFELSYRMISPAGEIRYVQERGKGSYDKSGNILYLQGHVMDATALVESRERLERAEKQAALGHWEFEDEGGKAYWSREMFRLLYADPAGGIPDVDGYLTLIHPEDRDTVRQAMKEMFHGQNPEVVVYRSNPDNGPVRHLKPTWYVVRDLHGQHIRYAGTLQDVTETQQSMQALQASERRQSELLALTRREQSRMSALLSADEYRHSFRG